MGNSKVLWIVLVIIILIIVGFALFGSSGTPAVEAPSSSPDMQDEQVDDTVSEVMEDDTNTAQVAGSYEAYAPEKLARANEGDVVLFFKADWCPTCRGLDKDITAHVGAIPEGLTILQVNYDDSSALRQKYGVTVQHTLVQVDADGTMIARWIGSPTLSALTANVK